jgi:hypothetical protein
LVECYWCGRQFPELYKLTVEDVQREHLPENAFQMACANCLDKIRAASNLVPEQRYRQSIINLAWMVPAFSVALFAGALLVSMGTVLVPVGSTNHLGRLGYATRWLGVAAALVGLMMLWGRTKHRYGFTHDLAWTLNSKRVNVAASIMCAGIVISLLSTSIA